MKPLHVSGTLASHSVVLVASALVVLLTMSGVAGQRRDAGEKAIPADGLVRFVDVSRETGVMFRNTNRASPQKHVPETMGPGGLFL